MSSEPWRWSSGRSPPSPATAARTSTRAWRAARARLVDGRTRVLVVGEFKQGKSLLVNGLVGAPRLPHLRRRRHRGADRRAARATPWRSRSCAPTASASPFPPTRCRPRLRAGQPRQPRGLGPRRGRAPPARADRRPGDRRHPRRRRPLVGARGRHDRGAARGGRRAARLRRRPGVHRARAGVPRPRGVGVPERRLRRSPRPTCYPQWRRIVELDRATWRRPGSTRRGLRGVVDAALARGGLGRRRRQRRVRLPRARRASCAAGCSGRPTGSPAAGGARRPRRHRADRRQPGGRADGPAGPGRRRRAHPRADRGAGARDGVEGAVGALAADPQRRHRRPQRRHRLRPARPDEGDQPPGRGRAAGRRRPGDRCGTSSRRGCSRRSPRRPRPTSSGRRSGSGRWPGRSPSTSPTTATPAAGAAQRPVRRDPVRAGDGRPGRRGADPRHEGADRAARRLLEHAHVRDGRHVRWASPRW